MYFIQCAFPLWRILYFVTILCSVYLNTPILFQKFNIDGTFKYLTLNLLYIFKIITLGKIAFISLRFTFRINLSYSNFSLIIELMIDIINKVIYAQQLSELL